MPKFNYLNSNIFEYYIKLYELISTTVEKEHLHPPGEHSDALIKNIFLQLYTTLEDNLYKECAHAAVKKNASILRFAPPLKEQGYQLDNDSWDSLLHIAKLRNCLLHGNGRLDNDKYGMDTQHTINLLNARAKRTLIELLNVKETSRPLLNKHLLYYFLATIEQFIELQK